MNKYVKRLVQEWIMHGKIIVATDFDDTISIWKQGFNKDDVQRTIELLKQVYLTGAHIVVFTACSDERYEDIRNHCRELGLNISSINKNPIDLPYGLNGKVYANIFLDDRAGLSESLDILEKALYQYRGYLENGKELIEIG